MKKLAVLMLVSLFPRGLWGNSVPVLARTPAHTAFGHYLVDSGVLDLGRNVANIDPAIDARLLAIDILLNEIPPDVRAIATEDAASHEAFQDAARRHLSGRGMSLDELWSRSEESAVRDAGSHAEEYLAQMHAAAERYAQEKSPENHDALIRASRGLELFTSERAYYVDQYRHGLVLEIYENILSALDPHQLTWQGDMIQRLVAKLRQQQSAERREGMEPYAHGTASLAPLREDYARGIRSLAALRPAADAAMIEVKMGGNTWKPTARRLVAQNEPQRRQVGPLAISAHDIRRTLFLLKLKNGETYKGQILRVGKEGMEFLNSDGETYDVEYGMIDGKRSAELEYADWDKDIERLEKALDARFGEAHGRDSSGDPRRPFSHWMMLAEWKGEPYDIMMILPDGTLKHMADHPSPTNIFAFGGPRRGENGGALYRELATSAGLILEDGSRGREFLLYVRTPTGRLTPVRGTLTGFADEVGELTLLVNKGGVQKPRVIGYHEIDWFLSAPLYETEAQRARAQDMNALKKYITETVRARRRYVLRETAFVALSALVMLIGTYALAANIGALYGLLLPPAWVNFARILSLPFLISGVLYVYYLLINFFLHRYFGTGLSWLFK